ncbi:hypothetical protein ACHAWF_014338 [Thalassiosira exigua]
MAGQSPLKSGAQSVIPDCVFKTLCTAFASMVRINQINGRDADNERKKLAYKVNSCMGNEDKVSLLIQWTTYTNIKTWFDNWEADLLELGFAERQDRDVVIPNEQLKNIINFGETCLSMDGRDGTRGGRPSAVLYDPNLPRLGNPTSKTAKTTTMITGSNALGEALPPHFQFQAKTKTKERELLNSKMAELIPNLLGQ